MQKKVTYPELQALMVKTGTSRKDLAKIIGKSYRTTSAKLTKERIKGRNIPIFNIEEAARIVNHFKNLGYNVTMDEIFFG